MQLITGAGTGHTTGCIHFKELQLLQVAIMEASQTKPED